MSFNETDVFEIDNNVTDASVLTSLWIDLILGGLLLMLFIGFQSHSILYRFRQVCPSVTYKPLPLPHGVAALWGWAWTPMITSDLEFIKTAGLDALMLNKISALGLQLFFPQMVVGLAVLLPLYATVADESEDDLTKTDNLYLQKLTLATLPAASDMLWIHWVLLYVYLFYAMWLLKWHFRQYVVLRQHYLRKGENLDAWGDLYVRPDGKLRRHSQTAGDSAAADVEPGLGGSDVAAKDQSPAEHRVLSDLLEKVPLLNVMMRNQVVDVDLEAEGLSLLQDTLEEEDKVHSAAHMRRAALGLQHSSSLEANDLYRSGSSPVVSRHSVMDMRHARQRLTPPLSAQSQMHLQRPHLPLERSPARDVQLTILPPHRPARGPPAGRAHSTMTRSLYYAHSNGVMPSPSSRALGAQQGRFRSPRDSPEGMGPAVSPAAAAPGGPRHHASGGALLSPRRDLGPVVEPSGSSGMDEIELTDDDEEDGAGRVSEVEEEEGDDEAEDRPLVQAEQYGSPTAQYGSSVAGASPAQVPHVPGDYLDDDIVELPRWWLTTDMGSKPRVARDPSHLKSGDKEGHKTAEAEAPPSRLLLAKPSVRFRKMVSAAKPSGEVVGVHAQQYCVLVTDVRQRLYDEDRSPQGPSRRQRGALGTLARCLLPGCLLDYLFPPDVTATAAAAAAAAAAATHVKVGAPPGPAAAAAVRLAAEGGRTTSLPQGNIIEYARSFETDRLVGASKAYSRDLVAASRLWHGVDCKCAHCVGAHTESGTPRGAALSSSASETAVTATAHLQRCSIGHGDSATAPSSPVGGSGGGGSFRGGVRKGKLADEAGSKSMPQVTFTSALQPAGATAEGNGAAVRSLSHGSTATSRLQMVTSSIDEEHAFPPNSLPQQTTTSFALHDAPTPQLPTSRSAPSASVMPASRMLQPVQDGEAEASALQLHGASLRRGVGDGVTPNGSGQEGPGPHESAVVWPPGCRRPYTAHELWAFVREAVWCGEVRRVPSKPGYSVVSATFWRLFPHDYDCVLPVLNHQKVDLLLYKLDSEMALFERAKLQYRRSGRRPMRRPLCYGLLGPARDVITDGHDRMVDLQQAILDERRRAGTDGETPSWFVFFKSQVAAAQAAQCILHGEDSRSFRVHPAPGPEEVYWPALWLTWRQREFRNYVTSLLTGLLLAIPVGIFTGALQQLEYLMCPLHQCRDTATGTDFSAPLRCPVGAEELTRPFQWTWYCSQGDFLSKLFRTLLIGWMPALLLCLWQNAVLPAGLTMLIQASGQALSLSSADRLMASSLFYFSVFNVFLGGVLGTALVQQIGVYFSEGLIQVLYVLGNALPSSSNYFLSYILFRALVSVPMRLLFPHIGIRMYLLRRYLCGMSTLNDRDRAVLYSTVSPRYGHEIGMVMLVFLIASAFSLVSPLILPVTVVFFAFYWLFWRYALLYVYVRKYESGGLMWPLVFHRILWCLAMQCAFTCCVFFSKKAYTQAGLALVTIPIFIHRFARHCWFRFEANIDHIPLQFAQHAPRTMIDPWVYVPPPLLPHAVGWHPDWSKPWEGWGMPAYFL